MASIADVLSWVPLTEPVEIIKGGLPRPLTDKFYETREKVQGNVAAYVNWQGTRQVARMLPKNAPPVPTNKLPLSSTNMMLLAYQEQMPFQEELLRVLREWDQYKPQQMWAIRQLEWQGEEFGRRFENAEVAAINSTIANGSIWFDNLGNQLPSSSGAFTTVSQGIPTANTGSLNGLLTGSFTDPNFDIPTFLTQRLKVRALEDTNYPTRTAVYGANIPGYFAINNYTRLQWGYQKDYAMAYLATGQVPQVNGQGFCGFEWIPAAEMYYQDQTSTNQLQFPPDQITFMPAIDRNVWTVYEGSSLVPTAFGPWPDGVDGLRNGFQEKFGRYRYAWLPQGTTSLIDQAGHCFLPRMKIPGSTYLLNTTGG
jgi:hypothetical protein